jgi:hypothetical protein
VIGIKIDIVRVPDLQLKDSFSGGGAATFKYTYFGPTIFVYGSF